MILFEAKVALPEVDRALAHEVVADAHARCPYPDPDAIRGNVDVVSTVL